MSKEKTVHELAKEFPDKTYRELERYRDADRQEEEQQIPLSESQKSQDELEPIIKGVCVTGAMRKDREGAVPNDVNGLIDHYRHQIRKGQEAYDELLKEAHMLRGTKQIVEQLSLENIKMKKRAQAAEGELSILKGIETNRVKEAQDALANALEVNESHQKLNGKLQERLTELEEENKKMHDHLNKKIDGARKAGL